MELFSRTVECLLSFLSATSNMCSTVRLRPGTEGITCESTKYVANDPNLNMIFGSVNTKEKSNRLVPCKQRVSMKKIVCLCAAHKDFGVEFGAHEQVIEHGCNIGDPPGESGDETDQHEEDVLVGDISRRRFAECYVLGGVCVCMR